MKSILRIVITVGFSLLANRCFAQMVQIGPWGGVRVNVPFVHVDVSPFGGTRVRAPFVDITTPGYGYFPPNPVIVERHYPSADFGAPAYAASPAYATSTLPKYEPPPLDDNWVEPARDDGETTEAFQRRLSNLLVESASQLDHDLGSIRNGSSLRSYLSIPMDGAKDFRHLSAAQLDNIIVNFEALNRTREFANVARLASFQATRARLASLRRLADKPSENSSIPEEIQPERRAF